MVEWQGLMMGGCDVLRGIHKVGLLLSPTYTASKRIASHAL